MAAKSKKRLSKIDNKLIKLEKLHLKDVLCSICQSILVEPVTLPCYHHFCQVCFNGSIENNALCCPLCRLRIGSWLRKSSKEKNLVNVELWEFIKNKFSHEIERKFKGEDINCLQEKPILRLSAPGEIRSEYETELKRLRAERCRLEQKHIEETELLIKKIQEEEEEAHRKYLERLRQDEALARQIAQSHTVEHENNTFKNSSKIQAVGKSKLKNNKIDAYLTKIRATKIKGSPKLTDDNTTNTTASISKVSITNINNNTSPEMVPTYNKYLKNYLDRKVKNVPYVTSIWNKENGESEKDKNEDPTVEQNDTVAEDKNKKSMKSVHSLLVSLPYTGVLQHKNVTENRNTETDSVDSMHQELCYFKPIEGTTPTRFNTNKNLPLRVPGLRVQTESSSPHFDVAPSRTQYIEGLCKLRKFSLPQNLPSAFVIALNMLRVNEKNPMKSKTKIKSKSKNLQNCTATKTIVKNIVNSKAKYGAEIDGISKINSESTNLRRTRSMGSIKEGNETTPKKLKSKDRKISSERKHYLRSDTKKLNAKNPETPPPLPELTINNKVNLVIKNLSSPLKNCDVENILEEQIRIEKIIEQEKSDFELARKVDAEWNGYRQLRRSAVKRQVTINYSLRPAKKLKI